MSGKKIQILNCSAIKSWYFTSTECLYMCVRKPTSCTVELYMTPVKTGKWLFSVFQFPCSIRTALFLSFSLWKDRRSQGFLLLTSFSFSLVLFLHYGSLFCTLTSLFHSPSLLSYFVAFTLSCSLLPSVFLFSLSLSLTRSASPPSSQLSCSGIVPDHSTSKYLLLTVALCSPHLDHVILKSEGTALLFSMRACSWLRNKKPRAGEGKAMSPTAEPVR